MVVSKKGNRKPKTPGYIYCGDLCFFRKPTEVYPADPKFVYGPEISRIIWAGEPLTYIKRMKKGRNGPWIHCFESYELHYVYEGSIKDFTKDFIPYKEGWPEDE